MIMVALSYSSGYCQNDVHLLRGNIPTDTVYPIPISLIRIANHKLIEHQYCPIIINEKDSIIALKDKQRYIADSLHRAKIEYMFNNVQRLEQNVEKANKRKKIWATTAIGAVAAFFVTVLIK